MKALAAALVEAQKEMPVVHKTASANAGTFTYSYVPLDQLIEKTKPVLNKNGLVISQFPSETSTGGPGLRTILMHGASGESVEATVPLLLNGKNDMQTLGGAISYARRYGWAAVLGIANDEDDDGAAASAPGTGASQVSAPASGPTANQSAGGGRAAGERAVPTAPPAAPSSDVGAWAFPFGKHKGSTIAALNESDPGYLDWFLEKSDKQDIKDKIAQFRLEQMGATEVAGDIDGDSIPF